MKIHISHLGPVAYADLDLNQITVLTGAQASGKSTIVKTVYFFRTLKNDLSRQIRQYSLDVVQRNRIDGDLTEICQKVIQNKFVNTFGVSYEVNEQMMIQCDYGDGTYVSVSWKSSDSGYLSIQFSENINQKIMEIENQSVLSDEVLENNLNELNSIFHDPYETVYIPAGRSLITLLGEQYLLFYSSLDDNGKRMIDECTQDFIRLIPALKPNFSNGLRGLNHLQGKDGPVLQYAQELSDHILNGSYQFRNGEERLVLGDDHYVRMNYASSGQQSSVWIINLLYYYLANKKKACFIIEEPELNLFPESQKYISDLMMLAAHEGMQIIVTTHSPYILGELNNIMIASRNTYTDKQRGKLSKIIPDLLLNDYDNWSAYFTENGTIEDIIDGSLHQMNSDLLDGISSVINDEYDRIIECIADDQED